VNQIELRIGMHCQKHSACIRHRHTETDTYKYRVSQTDNQPEISHLYSVNSHHSLQHSAVLF